MLRVVEARLSLRMSTPLSKYQLPKIPSHKMLAPTMSTIKKD